jgi:hypothetical protein
MAGKDPKKIEDYLAPRTSNKRIYDAIIENLTEFALEKHREDFLVKN